MGPKQRTRSTGDETNDERRPTREDGLSTRNARPRHDERQPPRGYELQRDDWPVQKPPKSARAPSDEDKAIGHALIHAVQWAIGESDGWRPGPNDRIMDDETRKRLLAAYELFTGHHYFADMRTRRIEMLEGHLAQLLRLREQARVYKRIRAHKAKPDAPRADGYRVVVPPPPPPEERRPGQRYHPGGVVDVPPIATTGREIVERLTAIGFLHEDLERRAPLFGDDAPRLLAKMIDDLPENAVNLGGPGGRSKGRPPRAWAQTLVLLLTNPKAARANFEKRRRRTRRRDAP